MAEATDRSRTVSTHGPGVATVRVQDLVLVLVRGAPFALLVTVMAVIAAVLITRAQDPTYRASVAMVVAANASAFGDFDVIVPASVDAGVYRTAIYDGGVLRTALERIEGGELGERDFLRLSEAVRVRVETQLMSSVVRIEATDTSSERAARLVNTVAEELVAWDRERARQGVSQGVAALERSIVAIEQDLASDGSLSAERRVALNGLLAQRAAELAQARDAAAGTVAVARIELLAPATPPEEAVGPRLVLNVAVALLLGLVTGYGLLLVSWSTNPRVGNRDDLALFSGLPVLAEFTHRGADASRLSDEGTSWLRTRLAARWEAGRTQVLVVAGLRSADDKDGIAVGLAESFARSGDSTLLVDADLRSRTASARLGVADTRATPYDDVFVDDPTRAYLPVSIVVGRDLAFDLLPAPSGVPHPVDRLVRLFGERREVWLRDYDVVIVDAAPILGHADALAVAAHADGVVLCARRGRASRSELAQALSLLNEGRTSVVGTVLTYAATAVGKDGGRRG